MKFLHIESREVLAAALPPHRLEAGDYLRHAVEVDETGAVIRVLCKRIQLDSLADGNAGNRNDPPTCRACISSVAKWPNANSVRRK